MRLNNYLNECNYFSEYILLLEYLQPLNELSDINLNIAKKIGLKLGLRVKKSDTIFDYLKSAGKTVNDLFRTAALFLITDITDNKSRKSLIKDAKKIISNIDKRKVIAFLMQLDRGTLSITGHIRHILMSFFGLEIASYNKIISDVEYIKKEVGHIKQTLKNIDATPEEMKILQNFQNLINNIGAK